MSIPLVGPDAPSLVRTPDECFANLPGFPFEPHYHLIPAVGFDEPLRMHYIDEGPAGAPVVLMVHGEPTWSYLYRKLVPVLVDAGFRTVVPDLVGFGRSDKPTFAPVYTFDGHIDWLRSLVCALDLQDVTLVCQDWGGPIGLGVLARETERFAGVVAANTILHTAEPELAGRLEWAVHASGANVSTVSAFLLDWMRHSQRSVEFDAGQIVAGTTVRVMPDDVAAAYAAPFPSEWHKAGMRQFPLLIPVTESDTGAAINRATWDALAGFEKPFLTLFGDSDPPTRGWDAVFQERVPGARGQPHRTLEGAGHFWQEDCGEAAARLIVSWLEGL